MAQHRITYTKFDSTGFETNTRFQKKLYVIHMSLQSFEGITRLKKKRKSLQVLIPNTKEVSNKPRVLQKMSPRFLQNVLHRRRCSIALAAASINPFIESSRVLN